MPVSIWLEDDRLHQFTQLLLIDLVNTKLLLLLDLLSRFI